MLHSSELMPGGSPTFRNEASIERLYEDLEALFEAAAGRFQGATMSEFYEAWGARRGGKNASGVERQRFKEATSAVGAG
jgi:hypothetical protein